MRIVRDCYREKNAISESLLSRLDANENKSIFGSYNRKKLHRS